MENTVKQTGVETMATLETLLRTWDTATLRDAILQQTQRVADCKREGLDTTELRTLLVAYKDELAIRFEQQSYINVMMQNG